MKLDGEQLKINKSNDCKIFHIKEIKYYTPKKKNIYISIIKTIWHLN